MHLFEQQRRRCAITGNALSCSPLQLNTMRCVLHYHTNQLRLPFVCSLDAIHPVLPHHRGTGQVPCLRINLGQCGRCSHIFANILTPEQASTCTPTANLGTGLVALCVSWGLLSRRLPTFPSSFEPELCHALFRGVPSFSRGFPPVSRRLFPVSFPFSPRVSCLQNYSE